MDGLQLDIIREKLRTQDKRIGQFGQFLFLQGEQSGLGWTQSILPIKHALRIPINCHWLTSATFSSFWRCSTFKQGPILLFTRLIISCHGKTIFQGQISRKTCLVSIRNLRPSTSFRAKLVTKLEHSFTCLGQILQIIHSRFNSSW